MGFFFFATKMHESTGILVQFFHEFTFSFGQCRWRESFATLHEPLLRFLQQFHTYSLSEAFSFQSVGQILGHDSVNAVMLIWSYLLIEK